MTIVVAVTLVGTGQVVIFTGAVVGAATVVVRAPPARWLARTIATLIRAVAIDPLKARARQFIGEVVDERLDARPLTNGKGWQTVQAIADHLGVEFPTDPSSKEE